MLWRHRSWPRNQKCARDVKFSPFRRFNRVLLHSPRRDLWILVEPRSSHSQFPSRFSLVYKLILRFYNEQREGKLYGQRHREREHKVFRNNSEELGERRSWSSYSRLRLSIHLISTPVVPALSVANWRNEWKTFSFQDWRKFSLWLMQTLLLLVLGLYPNWAVKMKKGGRGIPSEVA